VVLFPSDDITTNLFSRNFLQLDLSIVNSSPLIYPCSSLISHVNLSKSFNYTPYLFSKKSGETTLSRDQCFHEQGPFILIPTTKFDSTRNLILDKSVFFIFTDTLLRGIRALLQQHFNLILFAPRMFEEEILELYMR
jgi:hypothetical protein